ncbi:PaaI family thioesterase [Methanocalculus sp.]|uniref:PaaI family thioesterase n=1 Tax=Methanocalculus sp. TaxID=2004547 RepID=UPI00271808D7|nr:PaaI family thioesterase [Methanocalculus sp.]MDO8841195.1 PaaI family thioesterase [Methanocalculus sp.]
MEYLKRLKEDSDQANPFFKMMGVSVLSFGEGRSELSMEIQPTMQNGVGWLQGGLFVALADEAMALALYTLLTEGEGIATISESTSFLRGVRDGTIIARGWVIRRGRRVAFLEGEVRRGDGSEELLARTTASFAIVSSH